MAKFTATEAAALSEKNIAKLDAAAARFTQQARSEMSSTINLDEAWKEHREEASIPFELAGRRYLVSRTIPLDFAMFMQRIRSDHKGPLSELAIPDDRFREFLELALGKEFTEACITQSMTAEFLNKHILEPIMKAWSPDSDTDLEAALKKKQIRVS